MLRQRLITSLFLVPLVVAGLFLLDPLGFQLVCAVLLLAATWEWTGLMVLKGLPAQFGFIALIAGCFFLSLSIAPALIFSLAAIAWVFAAVFLGLYPRATSFWGNRAVLTLFCIAMLTGCYLALVWLQHHYGPELVLYVFALVWAADSGAYFAGRIFGKHKLCPQISPGKTWEGVLGGVVSALGLALLSYHFYFNRLPITQSHWLLLTFLLSYVSVMGDLFISMLKRRINLKDTGKLLPGHGGLLDRLDSLLAVAPFFAVGMLMLHS